MGPKYIKAMTVSAVVALASQLPAVAIADGHEDFVAGVAAGVLGAAIAEHHHKHGSEYRNHPGVSDQENAIGLCMHRTQRAMSNQGYYAVDFVRTLSYTVNADG
ncbi:MAG: hypothetical protein AAGF74_11870, partial [Pseudomonadota bacterium]